MKQYFVTRNTFLTCIGFFIVLFSYSQQVVNKEEIATSFKEKQLRESMKADGLSDPDIDKWLMQQKLASLKPKNTITQNPSKPPVVYANSCGDMGGENGWSGWVAATGDYALIGGSKYASAITWNNTNIAPVGPRFNLTTGTGNDACTPGPVAGSPAIPLVAPGFGNTSIQLGQPSTNGNTGGCNRGCAERLTYSLNVTPADTNFIYAYAILFDFPASNGGNNNNGHTSAQVPYAEIDIFDKNGVLVPCSHQKYMGDTAGQINAQPGFYSDACTGTGNGAGGSAAYKPWTTVGVNLSKYVGQTLSVSIINADCTEGGHYCHSYWDFACPPIAGNSVPFCLGQQTTMSAPISNMVSNAYTYQWYINTKPYNPNNHWTIIPGATGPNYSVAPQIGDTFAVEIIQPSKCNFWIPFIPQILYITADFKLVNNCGTVSFTDISPPPNTGTISAWNWSFPGGTPSSSTIQNPVVTYTAVGVHTVTLTITSSAGCTGTKVLTVTTGDPVANFSTGPVCLGSLTLFSDSSVAFTGDPLNSWAWDFGDGTTSASQNPTHIYSAAGTYSVTLKITTKSGCTRTIIKTVTVNPIPVPAFTSNNVCFNLTPTIFINQSTGAAQYFWDFGDGNTSTQINPSHTYGTSGTFSVTLTVTNAFGCKAILPLTTVVFPLPVPNFTSLPVCLGNPTCFKDLSSVTPGTITGWSWNFGDPGSGSANTSSLQNPCHTYKGTGPFNVVLTTTSDSGCQSTITLPANTSPPPIAGIIPKNVCVNSSTTFLDGSTSQPGPGNAINSWVWNFGDGTPDATQQNPSHTYVSAGTYTITLIVTTVDGCKDTATNTVVIYNSPVPNFSKPFDGCAPVFASYTDLSTSADGSISNWQWFFPGGSPASSNFQNPKNIKYSAAGSYSVSLIVTTTYGCMDSIQLPMVDVYPWPNAEFCVAPTTAPATNPVFDFCDEWTSNVTHWTWNFGDSSPLDSTSLHPSHSYSATVLNNDFYSYKICIYVETDHGCWDTTCHVVELVPEFVFYIPNTFTPNADGTNELFYGKCRGVKEYNIWVFDRWGNQVWDCHHDDKNTNWDSELTNPRQEGLASYCKWDGIVVQGGMDMGGNSRLSAQEDVYVWKVSLLDIFNKRHTYVGHVNIVK